MIASASVGKLPDVPALYGFRKGATGETLAVSTMMELVLRMSWLMTLLVVISVGMMECGVFAGVVAMDISPFLRERVTKRSLSIHEFLV
jgi:hypothetical protein